jgi:chromosome segregation ATPase
MTYLQNARARGRSLLARRRPAPPAEVPDATTQRLDRQNRRIGALERDMNRMGPQMAALEARLESLRERLVRPEAGPGDYDEALSLVEEVRREHERIRARISAASRFEERLRQLEEEMERRSANEPTDGDGA